MSGSAFDEAKKEPSAFIASLIAECEGSPDLIAEGVPFPRRKADGTPARFLKIRLLSIAEESLAFANARRFVGRVTAGEENVTWKPDEIEDNARATEILAIACRREEDMTPFFPHGVVDTRCFTSDELGQLMLVYGKLKEKRWPAMQDMSSEELDRWLDIVVEGTLDYPFSLFSRTKLETFADLCATELVELRERFATLIGSSTSGAVAPTDA